MPGRPNFYVLGCFDKRITFYSQQVRSLSLVHALYDLGYLKDAPRVAVIGAGAAGLSAAAAIALASAGSVVLFEVSPALLPLQSATSRRKIDPHIYDWPRFDATDTVANLPILNWEAGAAQDVRQDVVYQFEDIVLRMNGRLEKRNRHKVNCIRQIGATYEIVYENLDTSARGDNDKDPSDRFDLVFLAIGFGIEPSETVLGVADASYWTDAGVPTAEFAARPTPHFFVSGNGDGGLIDLVAAASSDFDHGAMIRLITGHAGICEIKDVLVTIDDRARQAQENGTPFDIFSVYEANIQARITANGLIGEIARRLRSGVQITLQTDQAEIFNVNTSALNRLAVFAMIKACDTKDGCTFNHIHCSTFTRDQTYVPELNQPAYLLDCDGALILADQVIIRRGPKRAEIRQPFLDILNGYEVTHAEWLKRNGNATLVPILPREARVFFEERANQIPLPPSPRLLKQAAANRPLTFQLRADGCNVRWSGAIPRQNIADPWSHSRTYEVILPNEPADLGPAAFAILRMACHARNVTLYAHPAHWLEIARRLSTGSPHAEGMRMPRIEGGAAGGAAQDPDTISAVRLARQLHETLDGWMLGRLHRHLDEYLRSGEDPGHLVGLAIAADLRQMMHETWSLWHDAFEDERTLLNYFLRLMVCAINNDEESNTAQVLVGPGKLPAIIRGVAVSLAIASSWQATAPKSIHPGNLSRVRGDAAAWSGHGCAADLINGKAMSLCAGSFMWQTNFVILSVNGSIELATRAEAAFAQIESSQPTFTETVGSGPIVMCISPEFSKAVETGATALAKMLADVENQHFTQLTNAIHKIEELA